MKQLDRFKNDVGRRNKLAKLEQAVIKAAEMWAYAPSFSDNIEEANLCKAVQRLKSFKENR